MCVCALHPKHPLHSFDRGAKQREINTSTNCWQSIKKNRNEGTMRTVIHPRKKTTTCFIISQSWDFLHSPSHLNQSKKRKKERKKSWYRFSVFLHFLLTFFLSCVQINSILKSDVACLPGKWLLMLHTNTVIRGSSLLIFFPSILFVFHRRRREVLLSGG